MGIRQILGNIIDLAGTALGAPERGISERIAGGGTTYTGVTPQSQAVFTPTYLSQPAPPRVAPQSRPGSTYQPSTPQPQSSTPQIQTPSAPSYDISAELDAIYGPAYSTLAAQEAQLRDVEYPFEQKRIAGAGTNLKSELERQKTEGLTAYGQQETMVKQTKESAAQEAMRLFKAAQQRGQALFGGGSSTGAAVGEIAAQEFYRQQGRTEQGFQNELGRLNSYRDSLIRYAFQKGTEIKQWEEDQLAELNKNFRAKLGQLEGARNMLASEKSAQRLSELQRAKDMVSQIQISGQLANQKLDIFKQQMMFSIEKGLVNLYGAQAQNPVAAIAQPQPLAFGQQNPARSLAYRPLGSFEDEFGNILSA